jgi:hypothetical protein
MAGKLKLNSKNCLPREQLDFQRRERGSASNPPEISNRGRIFLILEEVYFVLFNGLIIKVKRSLPDAV